MEVVAAAVCLLESVPVALVEDGDLQVVGQALEVVLSHVVIVVEQDDLKNKTIQY